MTKRKLSLRQKRRIAENRDKMRQRSESQPGEVLLDSQDLGPEQNGLVVARYGNQADIVAPTNATQIRRCYLRANLDGLVTGDKVVWQDGEPHGVVVAQQPRQSLLHRPDSRGKLRPVAANIGRIAIVIAAQPEPHINLIDRYLVAAENQGIKPFLVLNKMDLPLAEELSVVLTQYSRLGYDLLQVSAKSGAGIPELKNYLATHTSILAGQSGVGKSSLINMLLPEAHTEVGGLSHAATKGRHTTTTARLFSLPDGGQLIDSPGIREFGLVHLNEQQVAAGFVEFRPYLGQCKFRNCQHNNEPGCALLAAQAEGRVSQQRLESYRQIVASLGV